MPIDAATLSVKVVADLGKVEQDLARLEARLKGLGKGAGASSTAAPLAGPLRQTTQAAAQAERQMLGLAQAQARLYSAQGNSARAAQTLSTALQGVNQNSRAALAAQTQLVNVQNRLAKEASGAQGAMSKMAGAAQSLQSALAVGGIGIAAQQLAQFGKQAIDLSLRTQQAKNSLEALAGSPRLYAEALQVARRQQQLFGGSLEENISGIQGLITVSRSSGVELQKLVDLSQRLSVKDPSQGIAGARIALNEAMAGDPTSLARRYEIPRAALAALRDESTSSADKLKVIDDYLSNIGITSETVAGSVPQATRAFNDLNAELENTKIAIGDNLSGALAPLASDLADVAGAIGQIKTEGAGSENLFSFLEEAVSNSNPAIQAFEAFAGTVASVKQGLELLGLAQNQEAASAQQAAAAQAANEATVQALARAYADGKISLDQYDAAIAQLNAATQQQSGAQADATEKTKAAADITLTLADALRMAGGAGGAAQGGMFAAAAGAAAVAQSMAEASGEARVFLSLMGAVSGAQGEMGASGARAAGAGRTVGGIFGGRAAGVAAGQARTSAILGGARGVRGGVAATGGAAKVSEAEKISQRLIEIEEDTARKLMEIDEKAAKERVKQQRALAKSLIEASNNVAVANETNDLELVGATGDRAKQLMDRERAEAQARINYVNAVDEAKRNAADKDAQYAQDVFEIRQDQIKQQQELDQDYYERQREVPRELQGELTKQYQEATDAIATQTGDRIGLAQTEAEERAKAAEDEKSAVLTAAADSAAALLKTGEAATTAKGQVEVLSGALSSLPTSITTTVTIRTVNEGGGAASAEGAASSGGSSSGGSSSGGSSSTKVAGGGTFLTNGPASFVVGDNPGGVELVTVTPISGRGRTSVGAGVLRMAGGGSAIVDSAAGTATSRLTGVSTPTIAGGATGGSGRGGGGGGATVDPSALLGMEADYLNLKERMEYEHFQRTLAEELLTRQRQREIQREHDRQTLALDRQQEARVKELMAGARERAAQQQAQGVARADAAVMAERNARLSDLERAYQAKAAALVAQGAQDRTDVERFWRTVQIADLNAAYEQQRRDTIAAYDRQAEDARSAAERAGEDAATDAEQAARDQAEAEFQTRRDALEDQQWTDDQMWGYWFGKREEQTKNALDAELKLFQEYWQKRFEAMPGGKEAWDALQKRASGGPVAAGVALVGEAGPELVRFGTPGYVYNAADTQRMLAGSGGVTIMIDLRGAPGVTPSQVRAVEEAGYRGAQRALAEAGRSAAAGQRTRRFS